jgi:hypothetical protein
MPDGRFFYGSIRERNLTTEGVDQSAGTVVRNIVSALKGAETRLATIKRLGQGRNFGDLADSTGFGTTDVRSEEFAVGDEVPVDSEA